MAEVKWTAAQQSAIEDDGGTLLVSAAAGSGKTAVLVEKAVRLITRANNPVPADSLLIVTFTNAAAEELRSRIALRLEKEMRNRQDDFTLRKQRLLLRRAFIGTMDAFCQQMVREHFAALEIPPDVTVADASLLEQLSAACLAETMEEMYEDENFRDFAALYGRSRSDREAEKAILALYDFTSTLPYPQKQLDRFAAMYSGHEKVADTPWGQELFEYARQAVQAAIALCGQAVALAEEETELAPLAGVFVLDLEKWNQLWAALEEENWDEAVSKAGEFVFPALRGGPRGYESSGKEQLKVLRSTCKDIQAELLKYCFICTETEFVQDCQRVEPMLQALCHATKLYGDKFGQAKLGERVLDFSDFEHLALQLLMNEQGEKTPLANMVSARYSMVMIDEYQDTNELQDALYTSLGNKEQTNLFYVGDVKQSIYRFRKANPGIFMEKKDSFHPFASGQHPAVLTLGHNFRSGAGVIHGVNFLFEALMSRQLGEVAYTQEEKLIQGSDGGAVNGFELRIIEDGNKKGDAAYVAKRIAQMVRDGELVRDKNGERPCNYGDFSILLRARAKMNDFIVALEAEGIPVMADTADQLLETPEVLPLTAVLAAIDNPGDDVNLAAALLGPLFRFTPDEMTRLRAKRRQGGLWPLLTGSEDEKIKEFVAELSFYRALAGEMPAGRLCEEIMERTGYLSAVVAMEGGAARQENLYRFIGWANGVSAAGRGGLSGFVRLVQSGKGPDAAPVKSIPGHVTILTIHKSKGLEYPVCFLADAAHSFNRLDLIARVQMHSQLGIGFWLREGDVLFPTLPAMAIRRRIEKETLSEEMRILYVALTRARERMIITFANKEPARYLQGKATAVAGGLPGAYMLGSVSSMADWITMAALCHGDSDPLLEHCGGVIPPRQAAEGGFVMSVESGQELTEEQENKAFRLTAQPDEQLVKRLEASFARKIEREELAFVPVKMSVSSIVKTKGGSIRKRPSFMYKSGLTAAEKGTAQHSFMQFANYESAKNNLPAEIERLVAQGYLDDSMAKYLDMEGIETFLASPLAGRLEKASKVWREYDFITALPAGQITPGLGPKAAQEKVLIQGIADALLEFEDCIEILDYKTDRSKTPEDLVDAYRGQLALYKEAIEKRFKKTVCKLTIWSFYLNAEVDIPF